MQLGFKVEVETDKGSARKKAEPHLYLSYSLTAERSVCVYQ